MLKSQNFKIWLQKSQIGNLTKGDALQSSLTHVYYLTNTSKINDQTMLFNSDIGTALSVFYRTEQITYWLKLYWFLVLHISIWVWSFVWRANPKKSPVAMGLHFGPPVTAWTLLRWRVWRTDYMALLSVIHFLTLREFTTLVWLQPHQQICITWCQISLQGGAKRAAQMKTTLPGGTARKTKLLLSVEMLRSTPLVHLRRLI